MASFAKRPGGWIARVRKKGAPDRSAVFPTKAEAKNWAAQVEAEVASGRLKKVADKTFYDVLERYIDDILPGKDGEKQETLRLRRTQKDPIATVALADLDAKHVAEWRDRRLQSVSADSVVREWSTLGRACTLAVNEWRWMVDNPFRSVEKPKRAQPRTRRISQSEIDAILYACGYAREDELDTAQARVGAAMLFAIETAMRAGEICALRWPDIDGNVAHVLAIEKGARKTKRARDVPLSAEARRILGQLPKDGERCFGLTAALLDALFRKAKSRVLVTDLHFHDTRAEALTRLSKKLNAMQLARVSGHQDLRILLQTYYRESTADFAGLVD